MDSERHSRYPDGITSDHVDGRYAAARSVRLLSLLVLGTAVAVALTGVLAGRPARPAVLEAPDARLEVVVPRILRNGMLFETQIRVLATRDLADATVGFPPALWRDITINTVFPQPAEERFVDGEFRLSYGPLSAGRHLEVKIDGQLNPSLIGLNRGAISLLDGDRPVATLPISIRILP